MRKIFSFIVILGIASSTLAGCTLLKSKPSDTIGVVSGENDRVTVSSAASTVPGFLVVHKLNNNEPGTIIGLSPLYPLGNISKVTIATTEKLQSGTRYAVVLHHDNSDGKFIAAFDLPAKNKQGQIVLSIFTAH